MTEAEAKEKWCPFARILVGTSQGDKTSANRSQEAGDHFAEQTLCIGSDCMAWRWIENNTAEPEATRGFCGLAGKP